MAANDDGLSSNIATIEAKVVEVPGAVSIEDVTEVTGDPAVEANLVVGVAPQVTAESVKARVPLLEYNSLSFDITELLRDDSLGKLLQDYQALLDNFNALGTADKLLLLLYKDLLEARAIKVIHAVEVVEIGQGREASPVVERAPFAIGSSSKIKVGPERNGTSKDRSCHSGEGNKLNGEFSEHGVDDC
jgi:hypothetical protein